MYRVPLHTLDLQCMIDTLMFQTRRLLWQVMPMLGALLLFQYSVLLGPPPELLPPGAQGSAWHTLAAADTQSLKACPAHP